MNTYLLYGLENYLINKNISDIKESIKVSDDNVIRFDMNEDSISSIIVEASTVSMFSDTKLIICDNSSFLASSRSLDESDIKTLTEYLDHQFEDVYIVFIVREEKIDQRKKISKYISKISKVIDCNKIDNYKLNSYIENYIRDNGYSISSKSVSLIISKVGYELSNIIKELEKLFIYKGKDKNISIEDIEEVITNNLETNIFELTNAIVNKEKSKINRLYNEIIKSGEDPIKLVVTLSNQFRLILQVKIMRNSGYSEKEIVSILKEHPYRISLAMQNSYGINDLKSILIKLSDLDEDIVTGKVDKYLGLELLLLEL